MIKKNRGITLIALVVTIVVLLILAAVSIGMLTGENGIITQAQKSKEETIIGEEKDAISIAYNGCKINNKQGQVTSEDLETELRNNGENATVETDLDELIITFLDTNNKYTITETGKVEYQKPLTPEEAEMIISAGLINEIYMYIETAGGEVKLINNTVQNTIEEIDTTDAIVLTTNGIRKKEQNCLIDKKGKVYTWGENIYGQLGNGTTDDSNMPICISDIEGNKLKGKNIIEIFDCYFTMIAKDSEGKIYTWGENNYGQLGNGTTTRSNEPICINDIEGNVLNGKNILNIYTTQYASNVIVKDSEGKIYTWGNNLYGILGNGTIENSSVPVCISDMEENALKGKNIVDIYDGNTVIAKDNNGKIYTWGENNYGQLGNGTTENSNVPICISEIEGNVLNGKNIVDIYTDGDTVMAKDNEGKIYTWGAQYLGNGTTENSSVPICISEIEGNALNGKNIVDIYTDGYTVIAKDDNGKIYTWGNNWYGQLGNGTTEFFSSVPMCINDVENSPLNEKRIIEIYANGNLERCTVIAKDDSGKIYTWGKNNYGQLGNGTTENSNMPICISDIEENALNGKNIVDIYIKDEYADTIVAKDSNGKIYTWGYNEFGQLGNGTTENSSVPTCISDKTILKNKSIKFVTKDTYEFIGVIIYISTDGTAYKYCWEETAI